jgi:dUTP pyrophosphatase
MKLKVKRLDYRAVIPRYETAGAAAFDLTAIDAMNIRPGRAATLRTGLAFGVPKGYVMLVYSRSGHGFKYGVRLCNSVGVIDSDYRGEVQVRLHNDGDETVVVHAGTRVAQAMLLPIPKVELVEGELSSTARGTGGMGSTGV